MSASCWPSEQELAQRSHQRQAQCIKQAHFPVLKELAEFDFSALPSLNRARILDLARGHYISQAETILLIGNPVVLPEIWSTRNVSACFFRRGLDAVQQAESRQAREAAALPELMGMPDSRAWVRTRLDRAATLRVPAPEKA